MTARAPRLCGGSGPPQSYRIADNSLPARGGGRVCPQAGASCAQSSGLTHCDVACFQRLLDMRRGVCRADEPKVTRLQQHMSRKYAVKDAIAKLAVAGVIG